MVVLGKLLNSVSINPVISTIKLLRGFVALYNQAVEITVKKRCVTPDIGTDYPNCTSQ